MKNRAWKRSLSMVLAFLMIFNCLWLPANQSANAVEEPVTSVLNEDFEGYSVGSDITAADGSKWSTNPSSGASVTATVAEVDGGKALKVTSTGKGGFGYNIGKNASNKYYSKLTLSYNIKIESQVYTDLLSFSSGVPKGDSKSCAVRLESHPSYTALRYNNGSGFADVKQAETETAIPCIGNEWHSVKLVYDKAMSTIAVYVDGVLTNATLYSAVDPACIGIFLYSATVYLDNIRITEEDHDGIPGRYTTLAFAQESYTTQIGKTVSTKIVGSPVNPRYAQVTFTSSDDAVADVDPDTGLVTGVSNGEATVTASYDTNGDGTPELTCSTKVIVYTPFSEKFDFEHVEVTDLTDNGWTATNGALSIVEEDGNKVLSFCPNNEKKGYLVYALGKNLNNITLSYNLKFTELTDEYLLTLLPSVNAQATNHVVRMQAHYSNGFRWYQGTDKKTVQDQQEQPVEFGADRWHTVKVRFYYNVSAATQVVEVYIDGQLTNVGAYLTEQQTVAAIGMQMYQGGSSESSRIALIDNIQITEENNDPQPMLGMGAGNQVEIGSTLDLTSALEPEDTSYTVTYKSSDEAIATVVGGVVTGVGEGEVVITATAKAEGKADIVATRTVKVVAPVKHEEVFDFENATATDLLENGWSAIRGELDIKDVHGNKVLSFRPNELNDKNQNAYLSYALTDSFNNITLSYNIKFTSITDEYLLTLLSGASGYTDNHVVRVNVHSGNGFRYRNGSAWNSVAHADDNAGVSCDAGKWHTVKIQYSYDETAGTQQVKVYIDGQLTNVGVNLTGKEISAIGLQMFRGGADSTRAVLLDNIRISENDNVPQPMLSVNGGSRVEEGEKLALQAALEPADSDYSITYTPADSTVVAVDTNGVVTGLKVGNTVITVEATAEGKPTLTATHTVTVTEAQKYSEAFDFENATAADLLENGWDAIRGQLTVKDVDGNKVLSFRPNEINEKNQNAYLAYALGDSYSDITLSYNIKFTDLASEYLLTLLSGSTGANSNQIIRIMAHPGYKGLIYNDQVSKENLVKNQAGEIISVGADSWHTVKIHYVYNETAKTQTVEVYVDGQLTNVEVNLAEAKASYIGMQMYRGAEDSTREVLLDNIRISEEDNNPQPMLALNGGSKVEMGETMNIGAALEPADGNYSFSFVSSDPSVAAVDSNGVISGLKLGNAIITVTAKASGKEQLVAMRTVTVTEAYKYNNTIDFENATADDLLKNGWSVIRGQLTVKDVDGNKVLSFRPNEINEKKQNAYLSYALGDSYSDITLSYNIKFTDLTSEYLLTLLSGPTGANSNQIIRIMAHPGYKGLIYNDQVSKENLVKNQAGEIISVGADSWHTVKIHYVYNETAKTQTVEVYVDGQLTNVEVNLAEAKASYIGMQMYRGAEDSTREVLLDNIRISEEDNNPQPMLALNGPSGMELGETIDLMAAVEPLDPAYRFTFSSSNPGVATVDANGKVVGLTLGETIITVTARAEGKPELKAVRTVKVTPIVLYDQSFDFESSGAADLLENGWSVRNGVFTIKTEGDNQVLSFLPQGSKKGYLAYSLGEALNNVTLSYNIKFTGVTSEYLLTLLPGAKAETANHIVRMEAHYTQGFRWYSMQTDPESQTIKPMPNAVTDSEDKAVAFAADRWHAVKIAYAYDEANNTQTVKVYIDGVLTKVGVLLGGQKVSGIGLQMYQGGEGNTTREVLLDNIRISEEDNNPVPVLQFVAQNGEVEIGNPIRLPASLAPAGVDERYDKGTITYVSSNTSIATVSADGTVTGLMRGTVTITATCKPKSGAQGATLTAQCTIKVIVPGEIYIDDFEGYTEGKFPMGNGWTGKLVDGKSHVDIVDLGGNKVLSAKSEIVDTFLYYDLGKVYDKLTLSYSVAVVNASGGIYPLTPSTSKNVTGCAVRLSVGSKFSWWENASDAHEVRCIGWQQEYGSVLDPIGLLEWHTVKVAFSIDDKGVETVKVYIDDILVDAKPPEKMLENEDGMRYLFMRLRYNGPDVQVYLDNLCVTTNDHEVEAPKAIIPEYIGVTSGKNIFVDVTDGKTKSYQITTNCVPKDVCLPELVYKSSNEEIATVDQNGRVTCLKGGTAVITVASAHNADVFDTVIFKVKGAPVTGVDVTKNGEKIETLDIHLYGKTNLKFGTAPHNAEWLELEIVSEDEGVVTLDKWGELVATGVGTAKITFKTKQENLKDPVYKTTLTVTVHEAPVMKTIYVSPTGSNTGSGSAGDKVSIRRAMELVAAYNDRMTGDIEVILDGGYYRQTSTIKLTQAHSGTNNYSVIWRAAEGAEPVIGGGIHIKGSQFKACTEKGLTGKGIYVVSVPEGVQTRQLFVNGVRAVRARSEGGLINGIYANSYIACNNTEFLKYRNIQDLEFVFYDTWTQSRCGVAGVKQLEDGSIRVDMDQPGWGYVTEKGSATSVDAPPVYYENAIELLDEPGEWYLDEQANKLYYMPRMWETMDGDLQVTIPVVEELMTITGAGFDNKVENIVFDGITFADTTWMRPSTNVGHADLQNNHLVEDGNAATHKLPDAAVTVQKANGIRFVECDFTRLGITGLKMVSGIQNSSVTGCHFYDISGSAINIGDPGYKSLAQLEEAYPSDLRMLMKNCDVINNYIHDIAVDYKSAAAVSLGYVTDADLVHNEIFNVPYSAFHIGYGWTSEFNNALKNMFLAYNFVHDVMCDRIYDGGAIYVVGNSGDGDGTYNQIVENYVRHQGMHHAALYADGGSTWYEFSRNVVDLSETEFWVKPDGTSKVTPRWALISTSGPNKLYSGNYASQGTTTLPGDISSLAQYNIDFSTSTGVAYCNPKFWPAQAKKIIKNSGLEEEYSYLRNGQAERIVTNLKDELYINTQNFQVQVSFVDGKDREMVGNGNKVYYETLDASVATVSADGVITAVGTGSTTLRVYVVSNNILDVIESKIYLGDVLNELKLDGEEDVVHISMLVKSKQLNPCLVTLMGRNPEIEAVTYTSNDTNVVTVDELGVIRPVNYGRTTITVTAKAEEQTISADFTVEVSLKGDTGIAYGTPKVDGKMDDIYLESSKIFYGKPYYPTVDSPVDIGGYAYMVWDEQYLYCYAIIIEDSVVSAGYRNAKTYGYWRNDALEIFLDTTLTGGDDFTQFAVDAFGIMRYGNGDKAIGYQMPYATAFTYNGEILEGYTIEKPEVDQKAYTDDRPVDGYVIEMTLPIQYAVGITDGEPKAGNVISFRVQNNNRRTQDGYTFDTSAQRTENKEYVLLPGEGMVVGIQIMPEETLTEYQLGSGTDSIVIHCSGNPGELTSVEVDGVVVDPANYTLGEGKSTVLTFKSSYLETLAAGEHKVTLRYGDDQVAEATITILAKKNSGGIGGFLENIFGGPDENGGGIFGDIFGGGDSEDGAWTAVVAIVCIVIVIGGATGAVILIRRKRKQKTAQPEAQQER